MYDDEFNGMGGSFILDPKTGKRTRVVELDEAVSTIVLETPAADPKSKSDTPLTLATGA